MRAPEPKLRKRACKLARGSILAVDFNVIGDHRTLVVADGLDL